MKTILIPTSSAKHLAKRLKAKTKDIEVHLPDLNMEGKRYFPDGEIYMKIVKAKNLQNRKVIVLHSGAPKPNEGLIELELILQILRDNNVKPEVFFTYFPYGMQDQVLEVGETNVAENLIEKLAHYYGVKKIYIIDAHFHGRQWTKKYPISYISAVPLLIKMAKKNFGKHILFLSPDIGGERRTKIPGMKKERINSYQVKMAFPRIDLDGKTVGVVDDMIKTGGTLLKFYEIAKKSKAKRIIALVAHGVFPPGISKIKQIYSKLYLTNTINRKASNIDITNLIIKTVLSIDSVET
ncbi:ribose-phosphate diphosphokinase [Patescibacteria group bacterium]|nr:ribose-phosphate diphosphokinase [Patescibacteria group bacterium]